MNLHLGVKLRWRKVVSIYHELMNRDGAHLWHYFIVGGLKAISVTLDKCYKSV